MKKTFLILVTACLVVASLWETAHCQEDLKAVADPAFKSMRRGPVPFNHDQHNEKAKITDCKSCHHLYKSGKLDPSGDSVGTPCSDCHTVAGGKGGMPLMRAFHRQCGNCHQAKGEGPVTCAGCHPKDGVKN